MTTAKVILNAYLLILAILGSMTLFSVSLPYIYPQQSTSIQGPTANDLLDFKKQPAIIYLPDQEPIKATIQTPLMPAVQQVAPAFDTNMLIPTLMSIGSGIMAKLGIDKAKEAKKDAEKVDVKADQNKVVIREIAQQNVQQVQMQKEGLKLQYDTMGTEKANAINNRPEITLKNADDQQEAALKTAAKA